MKMFAVVAVLAVAVAMLPGCAVAQNAAPANPADALRAGVPSLVWKGNLTALEASGDAKGVLFGKETNGALTPVAALSQKEKTRVVAVGAAYFLVPTSFEAKQNEQFMLNILAFLAGEKRDAKTLQIGALNATNMDFFLKRRGFGNARKVAATELENVDILLLGAAPLSEGDTKLVAAYLARGGALLTAATGSRIEGKIEEFSHNVLLRDYGIAFTKRMIGPSAPNGFGAPGAEKIAAAPAPPKTPTVALLGDAKPATIPPISWHDWHHSETSQPLKKIKQPANWDYSSAADYMRILERFPLLAERGWRPNYLGDPNLGFWGDPGNEEQGMRSMGNVVFTLSLLASDPLYDPSVSGISQAQVLTRARQVLNYMTRSHVTGDIVAGNGKKWGSQWQSSWWAGKMALGAQLIWDKLDATEKTRVENVVAHEANRHLKRRAPSGEVRDTKAEENAWDTEVLAAAVGMFPGNPNAAAWRAKLVEFDLNSISTPADHLSDKVVDGKPLKDQVYTTNVRDDFTIENHGAYHFGYMACPLHSLAWGNLAMRRAKQPVPQAQFHHFEDVWKVIEPTFLDTRFAYIAGKDWPRYGYGLYFILPALATLAQNGDENARSMEAARLQTFEREQLWNGDGTFFGKRFTNNILVQRPAQFESDCYANIGAAYLIHRLGGQTNWAKPLAPAALQNRLNARFVSEESGLGYVRSPQLFASMSWKMMRGLGPTPTPNLLFVPTGMDSATEWGYDNLLGQISVAGVDPKNAQTMAKWTKSDDGLSVTGEIRYADKDAKPLYTHRISVALDAKNGRTTVDSEFVTDAAISARGEGLEWDVPSDFFNDGKRVWSSDAGQQTLTFDFNAPRADTETTKEIPLGQKWLNLDDKLGVIPLAIEGQAAAPLMLRQFNRRNSVFDNIYFPLHYDTVFTRAFESREFKAGETILHTRFLLVAATAAQTAKLAG